MEDLADDVLSVLELYPEHPGLNKVEPFRLENKSRIS